MSHFLRVRSDANWYRGYVVTGADLKQIDKNIFAAVNGDQGGNWVPTSAIVIGGAGVIFAAPTVLSGTSYVQSSEDFPIVFGHGTVDDFFGLGATHSERTKVVEQNMVQVFAPDLERELLAYNSYGAAINGVQTNIKGARFFATFGVYNGAKIESVRFDFNVRQVHSNVPTHLPQFRVIAIDALGTIFPLRSPDALTDEDGFQSFPTPSSGAVWHNTALPQSFTYVCNTNHVMNTAFYSYLVEIIDEDGNDTWTVYGNIYISTSATYSVTLFDGRT